MKPTEPGFDADASCSVLWSFARPGKNEKVPAEVASLFTLPQGKTDLTLLTAAEALKDAGRDESGNFWGMVKTAHLLCEFIPFYGCKLPHGVRLRALCVRSVFGRAPWTTSNLSALKKVR